MEKISWTNHVRNKEVGISYIQQKEDKLIRLVTSFIQTYITHYSRKDRGKVRSNGKMGNKT
jgi:hypothetical protein